MRELTDFSKKSETMSYFNSIMGELRKSKVKSIFSLLPPSWNHHRGFRMYSVYDDIYILLEDGMCLVIRYFFVDKLAVEFRRMTSKEENQYKELLDKDFFHAVDEIYNSRTNNVIQVETCNLEYDCIDVISLHSVTGEYDKWIDGELDYVRATEETFDEIRFSMKNGKNFIICADDAYADGYTFVWSEDTEETITVTGKE